ncbi:MAG: LTA synthase family protein [Lachnospiraceae bacterium]|jgi:phosphoglycerol transferase MdoB-like AlkP superfamily enzyme|nr:LTA synthase family protein [Lachnospiraceae bacterium]
MEIIRKLYQKIEKICENPYIFVIILGILLNIGVEMLSRKSLMAVLFYMVNSPFVFLYNSLLISLTLTLALLIKRRIFSFSFLSAIWLGLGFVNSILLVFRTTPFTAVDILLVKSAYAIMNTYLSPMQIVLLVLLCVFLFIVIGILWWKAPKHKEKISYKKVSIFIGSLFLIVWVYSMIGIKVGFLAENFGNIGQAFLDYGFPYCFGNSLLNTGIDKPKDYSPEVVDELIAEVKKPIKHENAYQNGEFQEVFQPEVGKDTPNIIYLQLESFFDPFYVKGIEISEDPIPNFRKLKEEFTSGFLNVPSVGAGTANTEFEVITGMNLDFFGPGEYPYKTILKETTCESISYNMKELGYKAHAIHNNDGTFYERNKVFSQLGFDTFTSLEYMQVKDFTPMGWAKDFVLTEEIEKILKSTQEKDVIYTISVQGHGSYPQEEIKGIEERKIEVKGMKTEEEDRAFGYYVNQIYEMDLFIKELTDRLMKFPEKTVLILYGDHLPGFGFEGEDLRNGDIYQTEYVIWSNFELEKQDKDLEAYQLSAYVMSLLELYNGILTKYHQAFEKEDSYLEGLKLLQYDMLYGDLEVYEGVNPYQKTDLTMGIFPITIKLVKEEGDKIFIEGENFTEFSRVSVNGKYVETKYRSSDILYIFTDLKEGDEIVVHQVGKDNISLGETKPFIYS